MKRWWLALGLTIVLAGCAGGDKPDREANHAGSVPAAADEAAGKASASESERLVSVQAVLSRAAQKQQEVESFRGEFVISVSAGGEEFGFDGEMAFRAPGSMYMTMSMFGEQFEIVVELPDFYVNIPGEGWQRVSVDALGIDFEQFREYVENRGVFDIDEMSEALGDVEQLEDESINGVAHRHYRGELDVSKLSEALPEAGFDSDMLAFAEDAIQSAVFEFWVNPDTELPRRFTMEMAMQIPGAGGMEMTMAMDFLEYNGDVFIPEPPADAPSLTVD